MQGPYGGSSRERAEEGVPGVGLSRVCLNGKLSGQFRVCAGICVGFLREPGRAAQCGLGSLLEKLFWWILMGRC